MLYELSRIKSMRQKLGLTQSELAKLSGVSQSLITKVERGSIEPSYNLARKIFAVLDEQLSKNQKEIPLNKIFTKKIVLVEGSDSIKKAIDLMDKFAISQIPVMSNNVLVGSISEETIIKNYEKIRNKKIQINEIMDDPFPAISENSNIRLVKDILKSYNAVLITKKGKPIGIISKADLIKKL